MLRRQDERGGGILVGSASGDVDIAAGHKIVLRGENHDGHWVRVGSEDSSSAVTLAAPHIDVLGGQGDNSFAELVTGAGGSLTLTRRRIHLRNMPERRRGAHRGAGRRRPDAGRRAPDLARRGPGGQRHLRRRRRAAVRRDHRDGPPAVQPRRRRRLRARRRDPRRRRLLLHLGGSADGLDLRHRQRRPRRADRGRAGDAGIAGTGAARGRRAGSPEPGPATRWWSPPAAPSTTPPAPGSSPPRPGCPLAALRRQLRQPFGPASRPERLRPLRPDLRRQPPGPARLCRQPRGLWRAADADPDRREPAQDLRRGSTPGYGTAGLRPGDSLATALASGPNVTSQGTPAKASVGSYATRVTATASGQGYALTLVNGRLTVDPAPLTVTGNDAARRYGDANPELSGRIEGFLPGDDASLLDGALTLATTATVASPVGAYAIVPSGLTVPDGNYAISLRPRQPDRRPGAADRHRQRRRPPLRRRRPRVLRPLRRLRARRGRGRPRRPPRGRQRRRRGQPGRQLQPHPGRAPQRQLRHQLPPRQPHHRPRRP